MTTRQLYNEKKKIVHTPDEVAAAFENNPALVFALSKSCGIGTKIDLFGEIWETLPNAILTKCDLIIGGKESQFYGDQFLLVMTDATKEETEFVYEKIEASGIIPSGFIIYPKKRAEIKLCAYTTFSKDTPKPFYRPKKANLIIDGEDLLLTIRSFSKNDRDALKADGFIKTLNDKKMEE